MPLSDIFNSLPAVISGKKYERRRPTINIGRHTLNIEFLLGRELC